MSKDNSEPAFPAPEASMEHYGKADGYTGMSLRDYFAAKAITALIEPAYSDIGTNFFTEADADSRAKLAYIVVDAMLAARSA